MATNRGHGKLPLPRILFSDIFSLNDFHIVDTHRGAWKKCTSRVTFREWTSHTMRAVKEMFFWPAVIAHLAMEPWLVRLLDIAVLATE